MRRREMIRAVALLSCGALALTACASSNRDSSSGSGSSGGGDTFVFAASSDPGMLDPAFASDGETFRVARQQFEGLVGTKPGTTVGHVRAVDGVSLDVVRGATYGLVGESGCGKSTLGRAILRLEEPTGGTVTLDGASLADLKGEQLRQARRRMQMVFQDPMASLDPRQSVESLLIEPLRAHAGSPDVPDRGRWRQTVLDMLDVVGLPASAAAKYPHEFSGGQRQRIGIARAMILRPALVIADEPVSALDVSVQAQVINLLENLQDEFGLTYLVIAHDLAVVRHISDQIGVMYLGRLVEEADSDDLYTKPLHPYTISLMSAIPIPDPQVEDTRERILLSGDLPSPANPPSGCRFHTRCPFRQPTRCDTEEPVLRELGVGHRVACHWAEDIAAGTITATPADVMLTA